MQIIELIIIGIICFIVGISLAIVIKGRKAVELTVQLENSNSECEKASQDNSDLKNQLDEAKSITHQQELSESKLQEQFNNLQKAEKRLNSELEKHQNEIALQLNKLNETREKQHSAEKSRETALEKIEGLEDKVNDLNKRLEKESDLLQQERDHVSDLKKELSEEGKKSKSLETAEKEARLQLGEVKQTVAEQISDSKELNACYQTLENDHTELKTTLKRREEHFKEQMQQLNETRQSLTKEFENLANKIFEEKGKTFTQTSQVSIDNMLKPFREQIEGFQKRVNDVHSESIKGNTTLNDEIKKVLDIGLKMSKEANNLTSALKGDSQQRGAWGEAQLRRTLEMSGLIEDAHYEVQSSFKDTDGKQKQTDYLIKLPDNKHIIIDSKVTLNAYDRMVAAESENAYQIAMNEHIKAVRRHIDDLASKDYTNLIGMRSPSFVLMFMPIEPAYIEALKSNKNLFEYGYKKGIVLVSHTTLIPILRTVSNLWMLERSNAEAREISEKAGDIYNQVCIVAERLSKLGGTLSTVSNHYNNTVKALAGQQGLYGKVDRFGQLSAKFSKSLPSLEPVHVDFETDRLSLIVEPINEEIETEKSIQEEQFDRITETSSSELINKQKNGNETC